MSTRQRTIALFLAVLIVGTVPATVMAQQAPRSVLLDEDTRQVASVTVDGQVYEVYRIENVVWYASGVDIYADGERVRSEETAEAVLTTLARRRAIDDLGEGDLGRLQAVKRNVSDASAAAADTSRELTETLAYLDSLRSESVDNRSAYNATIDAAPRLTEFNDTAPELLSQLRSYERDAQAFIENATRLSRLLDRRANGSSVDPQRLYAVYVATIQANDALSEHHGFGGVSDGLSTVATTSGAIAENTTSVPKYGNQTAAHFIRVESTANVTLDRMESVDLLGFDYEDTQDRARSIESDLMEDWRSRRNAGTDVYYTLAALGLAAVAAAGYLRWQ